MKVMVDPSLPDHRKIARLCNALKIEAAQALGHLMALWCRTMAQAETGTLKGWTAAEVAAASLWRGAPKKFTAALVSAGLLEGREHDYKIHDWVKQQGDIVAKREEWRARQDRKRKQHRDSKGSHAYVTRESPLPPPSPPAPPVPSPSVPPQEGAEAPPPPAAPTGSNDPPAPAGPPLPPVLQVLKDALPAPKANGPQQPTPEAVAVLAAGTFRKPDYSTPQGELLRRFIKLAKDTTLMPNKMDTLRENLQAVGVRFGWSKLEMWLMDPANRGKTIIELQEDFRPRPPRKALDSPF